ncbi:MAG: cytochrome c oxidase assembly protein [Paracoccus sp. (in: a-proteobacteria)]|uniref:cytochrome c oxidase assembly protein n=1 Tax=Paracoccus sp. TaxID=267 RepID=UPI0039198E59
MTDGPVPYCGPAPQPGALWQSWNLDPLLLAGLALFALVLLRSAGAARRGPALLAIGALVLAFVSPLCAMTVALFSARSAHHLVLITLAAPALAVAMPVLRRLAPSLSLAALSGAMIAWHLPPVYDAVWRSDLIYWAMQAAMLLPAWAFWSAVLAPGFGGEEALRRGVLIGGLAGVMGFLGVILTFAPQILYIQHVGGAMAWGIQPLVDQQLAGLVMWVPGFLPVAAIAFAVLRQGWRRGFAA